MAKFLSYEDRLEIQNGLKEHLTFTEIGKRLGRDRTTITKEVRNYSVEQDTGYGSYPHNTCKYRKTCKRKKVCGTDECRHPLVGVCKQCELLCNRYCEQYEEEVCTYRFKPPYVCNGCSEVKKCTLTKTIYDALEAQRKATAKISESRSGILKTEGEIARLNEILVPLVKQGQSIHQIYLNNNQSLAVNNGAKTPDMAAHKTDNLISVSVDDTVLDANQYIVLSSEKAVMLDAEYLDTLAGGRHTLALQFISGTADAVFNVVFEEDGETNTLNAAAETDDANMADASAADSVQTKNPQNGNYLWWLIILLLVCAVAAGIYYYKKKTQDE